MALVLTNARLLNVHSGTIDATDIRISGARIAAVGPGLPREAGDTIIDCGGRYIMPGLIDAHMHVDTTFLCPSELARAIVPRGTTTLFVDSTNNAHVGGADAITALMRSFEGIPLRGIVAAPSYCPVNVELGSAAVEMTSADVAELLAAGAPAIGETVWTRLEQEDRDYVRTVQTCREAGLRVSGHGGEIPRGVAAAFDAYVAAGPVDDHCISRPADIEPRLRRGLHQFFVECTGRRGQLSPLLAEMLRRGLPLRRVSICIDNNTAMDIVTNGYGYMDYLVRVALDTGIPPVDAYRMATLHPAEHHREAASLGSVTPGRFADLIVMDDFSSFPPHKVIVDGRVVAEEGRLVVDVKPPASADVRRQTILIPTLRPEQLRLEAPSTETCLVRVIKAHDGDAFNTERLIELPVRNGALHADPSQDLLKIAVVERFGRFGTLGLGIVEGFGLKHGAIATSISVPFNNIVCVGTDDDSMWTAIKRIEALQGGFVVAADDEVLADVPLEFGGLMSLEPFETFLESVSVAEAIARERGCRLANPFKTLVSTVHTTLPDLGLTDRGLVDTKNGRPVSIFVEPARTPLPA